jgi:hypothetical protein
MVQLITQRSSNRACLSFSQFTSLLIEQKGLSQAGSVRAFLCAVHPGMCSVTKIKPRSAFIMTDHPDAQLPERTNHKSKVGFLNINLKAFSIRVFSGLCSTNNNPVVSANHNKNAVNGHRER